jgi:hypothetical protein
MNSQNFIEKSATFKGEYFNMRGFLNHCHYASKKEIVASLGKNTIAKITWICETDEDIHDLINIEEAERWNINIIRMCN